MSDVISLNIYDRNYTISPTRSFHLKAVSVSEKGATLDSCRHREGGDTSETWRENCCVAQCTSVNGGESSSGLEQRAGWHKTAHVGEWAEASEAKKCSVAVKYSTVSVWKYNGIEPYDDEVQQTIQQLLRVFKQKNKFFSVLREK